MSDQTLKFTEKGIWDEDCNMCGDDGVIIMHVDHTDYEHAVADFITKENYNPWFTKEHAKLCEERDRRKLEANLYGTREASNRFKKYRNYVDIYTGTSWGHILIVAICSSMRQIHCWMPPGK